MEVIYTTFPVIILTAKQSGQELEHGKENMQDSLEQESIARGQAKRASGESSLKSTDGLLAWWVLCSAAGAL